MKFQANYKIEFTKRPSFYKNIERGRKPTQACSPRFTLRLVIYKMILNNQLTKNKIDLYNDG